MKIKKRKKDYLGLSITIFSISLLVYIITSLFVGSMNVSLIYNIQTDKNKIEELKEENSKLSIKISELEGKDRVYTTAQEAGLTQEQSNIIYVGN